MLIFISDNIFLMAMTNLTLNTGLETGLDIQLELRTELEANFDLIRDATKAAKDDSQLITDIRQIYAEARNLEGFEKLDQAMAMAIDAHKGQYRESGDQYVMHPYQVSYLLHFLGLSKDVVIAGLLHDTIEDNPETRLDQMERIYREFGPYVLMIVNGLTADDEKELDEKDIEQFAKLHEFANVVIEEDIYAVKVADNITNLLTVSHMGSKHGLSAEQRQARYAQKTLENVLKLAEAVDAKYKFEFSLSEYLGSLAEPYLRNT